MKQSDREEGNVAYATLYYYLFAGPDCQRYVFP